MKYEKKGGRERERKKEEKEGMKQEGIGCEKGGNAKQGSRNRYSAKHMGLL